MKVLCPDCGYVDYRHGKAIVSLARPSYVWLCNCGVPSLHPSVEGVVVPMFLDGSPLDARLPDDLECEVRAFAVALRDSEDLELWAQLEATRSKGSRS